MRRHRLGYLARTDHKADQNKAMGRVSLGRADFPMSLLQGDVHYSDTLATDAAEPIRVRLIA